MAETTEITPLSLKKRLLFSVILILILAFMLETGACVYLKITRGYDGEHLMQYAFDPYKNILPTPGYEDTRGIRHNAQGFRHDGIVAKGKPEDTIRVFLMGASTAYGLGGLWTHIQTDYEVIKNEETISAYLSEELKARFPDKKIELINAAITSTWTHHHLIYLNQSILSYDPDIVIFLDGFNDYFKDELDHEPFASYAYGEQSRTIMGPPTLGSLAKANGWWFFRKSRFVHVAGRAARTAKQMLAGKPEQTPLDVDEYYRNWETVFTRSAFAMNRRIASLLELEGVQGLFVLQPRLILERARYDNMPEVEQKLFDFNVESYRDNYEQLCHKTSPEAARRMTTMVDQFGAHFFDASYIYDPEITEQIFTDYCHLTPLGNEILAQKIMEALVPLIENEMNSKPDDSTNQGDTSPPQDAADD